MCPCAYRREESLAEPGLPFFIERAAARGSAVAANDAGEISWIEVAGDRGRLERWLGAALPVRVVEGEPGVRAIAISGRELRTR